MATTIAIDKLQNLKFCTSTSDYTFLDSATATSSYEPATLEFTGTTHHKINLHMSPYAQFKVDSGSTRNVIQTMTNQYTGGAGLSLHAPSDQVSVRDTGGGIQNVRFTNNRWTLNANTYITGYTVDSNTGNLTVDMETADYSIYGGTGSGTIENVFSDYIFEQTGTATGWYSNENYIAGSPLVDNKRWKLKQNLLIKRGLRGDPIGQLKENEKVALETLREMVTEREFRKYLRYGFVLVPGESGAMYQVFRNRAHTKVWKGGKLIEEVCVRIKSSEYVPPTDNVIAFAAMIRADEEEFKKCGNVYKMAKAA